MGNELDVKCNWYYLNFFLEEDKMNITAELDGLNRNLFNMLWNKITNS